MWDWYTNALPASSTFKHKKTRQKTSYFDALTSAINTDCAFHWQLLQQDILKITGYFSIFICFKIIFSFIIIIFNREWPVFALTSQREQQQWDIDYRWTETLDNNKLRLSSAVHRLGEHALRVDTREWQRERVERIKRRQGKMNFKKWE